MERKEEVRIISLVDLCAMNTAITWGYTGWHIQKLQIRSAQNDIQIAHILHKMYSLQHTHTRAPEKDIYTMFVRNYPTENKIQMNELTGETELENATEKKGKVKGERMEWNHFIVELYKLCAGRLIGLSVEWSRVGGVQPSEICMFWKQTI